MTLEEKVDLLINCVLDESEGPSFSKLALSYDWDKKTIKKIFEIMDKYLNKEDLDYSFSDIEDDFEPLKINYQDLKILFLHFYDNRQYVTVIKQYLETNYKAFGNVSCEYTSIYNELFKK